MRRVNILAIQSSFVPVTIAMALRRSVDVLDGKIGKLLQICGFPIVDVLLSVSNLRRNHGRVQDRM